MNVLGDIVTHCETIWMERASFQHVGVSLGLGRGALLTFVEAISDWGWAL